MRPKKGGLVSGVSLTFGQLLVSSCSGD